MDEHVHPAVTAGLQRRGANVLTAQEVGLIDTPDADHLRFAKEQGRVIFTQDSDFLRLHAAGFDHAGIVYVRQNTPVGQIVRGLMLIFRILAPEDMKNHVEFL